jgi:type II secretory ATPase GspE/PulE/Tfp pilus assembly ATPase PilB-like protein/RNA polymerase subunit RPABC4/transcription elongation factor Spt4
LEDIRHFLRHSHGMILVVGPTGSGKTTTLCSAISSINSNQTNIITIEDPIEYQIPGVNQTQVNDKIKLTFANSLRAILRQDPDVILLGEIRDYETAKIAMQAAQTGHLVLSTLHTDDAPSTVTRLMDMGVEAYVMGSALIGVVAQRLVRKLCVHCRRQYTPSIETLRSLNISEAEAERIPFYRAVGCESCNYTGYRGRSGIYEIMRITDKIRRLIALQGGEDAIRDAALAAGMTTLGDDGLSKVKSGVTTLEELLRVVTEARELRTVCPDCGRSIELDFRACPHCGQRLVAACHKCGRTIQPGWNFCPSCTAYTIAPRAVRAELPREEQLELPAANVTEFKKA